MIQRTMYVPETRDPSPLSGSNSYIKGLILIALSKDTVVMLPYISNIITIVLLLCKYYHTNLTINPVPTVLLHHY